MRKRVENKCTNCIFFKSATCPESCGVVVWKNCWKFKPDIKKLEMLHLRDILNGIE